MKRYFYLLVGIFILSIGCGAIQSSHLLTMSAESSQSSTAESKEKDETKDDNQQVVMRSVGDLLIHDTVYWDAQQADGSFDFDLMLKPVKKYLKNADITTANLEVLVAGEEYGLSTYPLFNAPDSLLDTLVDCGIDLVNNGTNHTMDLGPEGTLASINQIRDRGITYVGSYRSWDDYNDLRIIEANGLKIGFLSYCYGANGNWLPEDQQYLLSLIDPELMELEIKYLNQQVDASVVMIHNGEEYLDYPTEAQIELNQQMIDAGANFILGGHPHHLQPFESYNKRQAGLYSHGNFLSGQYPLDTKLGGISEVTFVKDQSGQVVIDGLRFMPTYCLGLPETNNYQVIPLADWEEYGLWGGDIWFEEIVARMTAFSDKVEVVDYLD